MIACFAGTRRTIVYLSVLHSTKIQGFGNFISSFYMEVYHSKIVSQFCDEALSSMSIGSRVSIIETTLILMP
jgi:hypothetical protein